MQKQKEHRKRFVETKKKTISNDKPVSWNAFIAKDDK